GREIGEAIRDVDVGLVSRAGVGAEGEAAILRHHEAEPAEGAALAHERDASCWPDPLAISGMKARNRAAAEVDDADAVGSHDAQAGLAGEGGDLRLLQAAFPAYLGEARAEDHGRADALGGAIP